MSRKRKAQINLEFLASAGFYLIALGAVLTAGSEVLPQYSQSADRTSLNLEARSLTNQLVSEKGTHTYNGGGTDWESSRETVQNTTSIGLASDFLQLERSKIEALSTVSPSGQQMNYTHFKDITEAENQYRFEFVWMPTVRTHKYFTRTEPPDNPDITEPDYESYSSADGRIHYGEVTLDGESYKFLVTSHNGVYDRAYISDNWDFELNTPRRIDEEIPNADFQISAFQNRERQPGSMLILKNK